MGQILARKSRYGGIGLAACMAGILSGCLPVQHFKEAKSFNIEAELVTPSGPRFYSGEYVAFDYSVAPGREDDCRIGWIGLCLTGHREVSGAAIPIMLANDKRLVILIAAPVEGDWLLWAAAWGTGDRTQDCVDSGRHGCLVDGRMRPFFALIADPNDPASVQSLDAENFEKLVGKGYALKSLQVSKGGAAEFSRSCLVLGFEQRKIAAFLPFIEKLKATAPSEDAPSSFSQAVRNRSSYTRTPLSCREAFS